MIERFYTKLDLQLAALSAMLILSCILSYIFNFVPFLRFSLRSLFIGLVIGIILFLLRMGLNYLINTKRLKYSLTKDSQLNSITFGKIVTMAAGEETLLRGFIFVPLVISMNFFGSTVLALAINAALSILFYSNRSNINYIAGIQASILAIIYLQSYSIFTLVIARFTAEMLLVLASQYKLTEFILQRVPNVFTRAV